MGRLDPELIPCAERVRFVSSGTEATMLAIRIGRAYSGKNKILRFEGHYHGWHEFVDLGMNAPYDKPTSLGILPGTVESTVVVKPDPEHVADALNGDDDIGTIICEVSVRIMAVCPYQMDSCPNCVVWRTNTMRFSSSTRSSRVSVESGRPTSPRRRLAGLVFDGENRDRRHAGWRRWWPRRVHAPSRSVR